LEVNNYYLALGNRERIHLTRNYPTRAVNFGQKSIAKAKRKRNPEFFNFFEWLTVHNFYKILRKSSQKHPMTFIRDNLVSGKMHALRAVIWRNLRVLLFRQKCQIEPGSQNCEPGSQFRILNQTALQPFSVFDG
jgi:hypothetical protein